MQGPIPLALELVKTDGHQHFSAETSRRMGPCVRSDDNALFAVHSTDRHIMTRHIRPGLIAAVTVLVFDQLTKLWLLHGFDLAHRGVVTVTPFFDLVLAWNPGISFGWFQSNGPVAQFILMSIKAVAVIVLAIWMARSRTRLAILALGLIIGGAIGNGIDSFAYGAVVDFALLHLQIGGNTYNWYVFNLADCAIVAGVAALLYDSFLGVPAAKAP
jgi:signal peptidase II